MPWKQVWEPNPSNEDVPVLNELPTGFVESTWGSPKTAKHGLPIEEMIEKIKAGAKMEDFDHRCFYHCCYCKGWIEGEPYQYREDNIGPLCGRRGTAYSCQRCGHEIGFSGMMA